MPDAPLSPKIRAALDTARAVARATRPHVHGPEPARSHVAAALAAMPEAHRAAVSSVTVHPVAT